MSDLCNKIPTEGFVSSIDTIVYSNKRDWFAGHYVRIQFKDHKVSFVTKECGDIIAFGFHKFKPQPVNSRIPLPPPIPIPGPTDSLNNPLGSITEAGPNLPRRKKPHPKKPLDFKANIKSISLIHKRGLAQDKEYIIDCQSDYKVKDLKRIDEIALEMDIQASLNSSAILRIYIEGPDGIIFELKKKSGKYIYNGNGELTLFLSKGGYPVIKLKKPLKNAGTYTLNVLLNNTLSDSFTFIFIPKN